MEATENTRLEYFEKQAERRANTRKKHSYYWNDITYFCNYFAHDDLSILEVGCGTGELLNDIKGKRKVGVDFSRAMIDMAKKQYPALEFHCMAAENITLDEKFDLIILSNLIGHLEDVQKVLEALHKYCHPRTKIIVTYHNYLWEPLLKLAEAIGLKTKTNNLNWLGMNDLNNILYLSGFDVYRSSRRMLLPINIPLIAPLFNKYIAKLPFFRHFCINQFAFAKPLPKSEMQGHSVSVIIPARNESGNIENAIKRLPKLGTHTEIIFIEGNSTDDTWDTIQKTQQKYSGQYDIKIGQQKGKGKGDAVRVGFDMATCDVLMILDADLTVPPEDLVKFYDAIDSGKGDFINGSRLVYPMDKEAMRFLNLLGNKFFSLAFTWLLDRPFKDTLCGTKVIFRDDYARLKRNRNFFGEFDPFGDYDLLFGAYKLNLKMVEIPIRYKERTYGTTNISRFKHGLLLLRMCAFAARKIKFI
ncbi:MAG TPA: bifunctional class I SAM-dependent methyltransferase/glycosyltransferase family 2 protein [Bacteroidia bacterium]|nr:bifunctional class I SAM-dependent methyltransferase/glycosyltransferase family 2 protein [Bacteroidia bacterium]